MATLVRVAKRDGDLSAPDKTMIGDAFVARKATDKAQTYYKEVLVKQLGFPKAKDVLDSNYGGPRLHPVDGRAAQVMRGPRTVLFRPPHEVGAPLHHLSTSGLGPGADDL